MIEIDNTIIVFFLCYLKAYSKDKTEMNRTLKLALHMRIVFASQFQNFILALMPGQYASWSLGLASLLNVSMSLSYIHDTSKYSPIHDVYS